MTATLESKVSVDGITQVRPRRAFLVRAGEWTLGVAASCAALTVGAAPKAQASPGCCSLYYQRTCSGQEWAVGCGYCASNTDALGDPTGSWWWSCPQSPGVYRFCGECWFRSCSITQLSRYNVNCQ